MPIRLALSLHAPDEALRSQIMPVNDRYPLADVLEACDALYERRAPDGLHRVRDARRRQRPLRAGAGAGASCSTRKIYKVNLIPYNPTGSIYDGSGARGDRAFRDALEAHGVDATVRLTRGRDIDAACGQLAAKALRRRAGA